MELLAKVFQSLLSVALTALPVIAVVLLARLLMKKAPQKYSYVLWLVVAFRLVCPAAPESPVGLVQADRSETWSQEFVDRHTALNQTVYKSTVGNEQDVEQWRESRTSGTEDPVMTAPSGISEPAATGTTVLSIAAALWLLGLTAMLIWMLVSWLRLRRLVAAAVRREGNVWECDNIPTPFVFGIFRPRIYIPFRMEEEEQTYVLAHERHHIRRGDHIVKPLALLLLAVYWWNPAVWLCWVLFCRDMEMSCDEAVLAKLGDSVKAAYSLSLVDFARRSPVALAFSEHDAARRVKNVLNWKRAKPAVVFLALALVVLVAAVCGTNAREPDGTWVWGGTGANCGSFTYRFSENVHSYAICQEVYHGGELVSPTSLMMFDNMEELGGVTRRQGTFALELQTSGQDLAGSALVIQHDGTTATFNRLLAVDFPECDALAWCWREGKTELPDDGSVIIGAVYYDDGQESYTWDCEALEEQGISETLKGNEWTVVLRLVVSTGDADQLAVSLGTIGQAQALYDLRVSSMKDYTGIRALASVLGVDELGVYSIVNYEQVVEFAFEAPLSEQQETEMWKNATVLLALIEDADQINYSFPTADGSKRFTNYCGLEQPDSWVQNIGYDEIKAMGQSVQGVQELLNYLGLDIQQDLAGMLFALKWEDTPDALVSCLLENVPWGLTPERLTHCHLSPNTGSLYLTVEQAGASQENLAQASALVLLALREDVSTVIFDLNTSVEEKNANGGTAASTMYRVSVDEEVAAEVLAELGTTNTDIRRYGESPERLRELLTLLEDMNRNTIPGNLFSTLSQQQPLRAFMDLLVAETWGALPGDVTAYGMPVENGALTVHFENTPSSPNGFDAYLAKAALVLMYVKPEVTEVCWSYPGGGGENTERRVRWEDRAIITSLFSNYEASSTYPVTSQEELQHLLAYADLGDQVYFLWIQSSSEESLTLPEGAEPFEDIMGYSGFSLVTFDSGFWQERTYYAVADTGTFPVAESFGFVGPRDYAVDLDSDGVTELVCNVQFGGDGAERVYVYQRRADGILRGYLDTEDLPGHVDWSVNSVWEEYDPAKNVFRIHYAVEGQDDYAVLEANGLERVRFEKYQK